MPRIWTDIDPVAFLADAKIDAQKWQQLKDNIVCVAEAMSDNYPQAAAREYAAHDHALAGGPPIPMGWCGGAEYGKSPKVLLGSLLSTLDVPVTVWRRNDDIVKLEVYVRARTDGQATMVVSGGVEDVETPVTKAKGTTGEDFLGPLPWIKLVVPLKVTAEQGREFITLRIKGNSKSKLWVHGVNIFETCETTTPRAEIATTSPSGGQSLAWLAPMRPLSASGDFLDADDMFRVLASLAGLWEKITGLPAPGFSSRRLRGHMHRTSNAAPVWMHWVSGWGAAHDYTAATSPVAMQLSGSTWEDVIDPTTGKHIYALYHYYDGWDNIVDTAPLVAVAIVQSDVAGVEFRWRESTSTNLSGVQTTSVAGQPEELVWFDLTAPATATGSIRFWALQARDPAGGTPNIEVRGILVMHLASAMGTTILDASGGRKILL